MELCELPQSNKKYTEDRFDESIDMKQIIRS